MNGPSPAPFDPGSRPTVSICIPALNEERNIGRLLDFLMAEEFRAGNLLEVLVEVSGSTDATPAIVQERATRWPLVRPVDAGKRDGLAAALSRLFKVARGQVLVRLDADVAPQRGALDQLVAALKREGVGISSPQIVPSERGSNPTTWIVNAEYALHHRVSLRSPKTTVVQVFRNLPIQLTQGAEYEDNLIQDEIARLGLKAVYVPEVTVTIQPPIAFSEYLGQRTRLVSQAHWYVRNAGRSTITQSPRSVVPALLDLLRAPGCPYLGLALFTLVEGFLQATVPLSEALLGRQSRTTWTPLQTTKAPVWSSEGNPPSTPEHPG